VVACIAGVGSAAALAAALLVSGAAPAESRVRCSVVAQGPAQGRSWAERREELLARGAFGYDGGGRVLGFSPGAAARCAEVAASAEVRFRIALLAPAWQRYGHLIAAAAARHGVPAELILTAIVEESGGNAHAVARYPGYVSDAATPSRISLGLGQMLLSTAQRLAPERRITRAALFDPAIAIDLVARYFARLYPATGFHPALAGSSYNAGNVHGARAGRRWSPPNARYTARFVAVFSASVALLSAQPIVPAVSFAALLR
jgi:soluble lytic murein transglycosylase-like protein